MRILSLFLLGCGPAFTAAESTAMVPHEASLSDTPSPDTPIEFAEAGAVVVDSAADAFDAPVQRGMSDAEPTPEAAPDRSDAACVPFAEKRCCGDAGCRCVASIPGCL
jgi:hypothetical protein